MFGSLIPIFWMNHTVLALASALQGLATEFPAPPSALAEWALKSGGPMLLVVVFFMWRDWRTATDRATETKAHNTTTLQFAVANAQIATELGRMGRLLESIDSSLRRPV